MFIIFIDKVMLDFVLRVICMLFVISLYFVILIVLIFFYFIVDLYVCFGLDDLI